MRSLPLSVAALALLGLFSLGASCDSTKSEAAHADPGKPTEAKAGPRIDTLPQVDLGELTSTERELWADIVNDKLSPCGEPVSIAQCVSEARACKACVPAARYVTRLVAEGFAKEEIGDLIANRYDPKKQLQIDVGDSPIKGAPMAPVTIVEFSDFECPYCGAAHPQLARVLEELDGKAKLVFKNFPLDGHKNAMPAARAARAAHKQGKFWELADKMFANQSELSTESIRKQAEAAGLDLARWDEDVASAEVQASIDADKELGKKLEITGTPSLFVNGRRFQEPLSNLPAYVKEELGQ